MLSLRTSCAAACASLSLVTLLFTGCADQGTINGVNVTGNWQLRSSSPNAAKLAAISGELTGTASAISGLFHADATTACVPTTTVIEVTGSTNADDVTTLSGSLAGGTLSISGTLATDGKSLTSASYNVSGGSCAFSAASPATAQLYTPINGTYAGSFSDPSGQIANITATLSQTPQSDTSGNFQLSGSASFPQNPCFNSPVTISNSQVTGGSFNFTYADSTTGNTVVANGSFSTDGTTLTVANWSQTGPCGADSGTGLLTKQ